MVMKMLIILSGDGDDELMIMRGGGDCNGGGIIGLDAVVITLIRAMTVITMMTGWYS